MEVHRCQNGHAPQKCINAVAVAVDDKTSMN